MYVADLPKVISVTQQYETVCILFEGEVYAEFIPARAPWGIYPISHVQTIKIFHEFQIVFEWRKKVPDADSDVCFVTRLDDGWTNTIALRYWQAAQAHLTFEYIEGGLHRLWYPHAILEKCWRDLWMFERNLAPPTNEPESNME